MKSQLYLALSRSMSITTNAHEDLGKFSEAHGQLRDILHRDPSDEELASHLEWNVSRVKAIRLTYKTFTRVGTNVEFGHDGTEGFDALDMIPARDYRPEKHPLEFVELMAQLEKALNPRSFEVLQARLIEERTLLNIAQEIGLTKERVRQISIRALEDAKSILKNSYPNESFYDSMVPQ